MTPTRKLTAIALVIAFIQFTNALEYMVFNPIFLYMAADFSVPVSYAGYVSAAYTLAAVISGIGAFYWIGGVKKRRFLLFNVALLGVTTLLIAATRQFYWLLALRLLAGLLGGTTMGVGIGLLLNAAPAALHGRMLATVIASFSLVSIIGMPGMLYLCEVANWRVALAAIGGLCLLAAVLVALFVPRDAPQPQAAAPVTLDRRLLLFASAAGLTQFSPMLLIPVLAPLLTQRLQVADAHLAWLFLIGGVAGYLATVLAGRWLQRFGAVTLTVSATLLLLGSLWLAACGGDRGELFMIAFLAAAYARLVAISSLSMRWPDNRQRAAFGTLQTALIHLSATVAFLLSSALLSGGLTPLDLQRLLWLCALSAVVAAPLSVWLQARLRQRAA
ncbi:MFS transporter [Serratia marcescens]|jgi:predicted MFS family arabinose efflux permease|uniref:MFS transporter n=1 Tax=Serratia TaxID=613 RepID=UPI0013DC014E|nr:MFS transporter [Serratia marcescens]MBH2668498.1 MFS transporter [Serratia marcescens]MBH2673105.1 MFS transporter [Serratia marcescens]MBH3055294.1 MFS transporter [Serratia marcescens]MBH3299172.1 MFS transporter [Serratia marcescens]MDP8798788.1 MFS transporter [Serratia marcescens]